MKTIFRFFGFGLVLSAMAFASAGTVSAQADPPQCADVDGFNELYTKFTATISVDAKTNKSVFTPKTVAEKEAALTNAKQILEKFGECKSLAENVNYVKSWVSPIENMISTQKERDALGGMFTRFDAGIQGEKYDEAYAAGRDILAKQPDNLNILIPLGQIGLYQSYNKNFKYNDDTLRYAQQALTVLKSGKELPKKNKAGVPVAGAFQFECAKEDCINDLTYAIAYINYYGKDNKKGALPYYYEVSQSTKYKNDPRVYATIGSYYVEDARKLGTEIEGLIAKQKAAPTDEEKATIDTEIKAKIAMFKGYTERSLDAYSRAYKVAKDDTPANKTYKEGLYKIVQDLYQKRFEKTDGVDAYISAAVTKPLPNPTSDVTPVTDPEPAKTTGSTAPAATAPVAATPATPVKPTASTATTTKVPAKKAVAVKKNR